MIPVNGFFEYGIMALLGGVGMIGLAIWNLTSNQMNEGEEIKLGRQADEEDREAIQYKKAA